MFFSSIATLLYPSERQMYPWGTCVTQKTCEATSTLGFSQHKIAVTICRNKEQRQEHAIATTTGRPAQNSP